MIDNGIEPLTDLVIGEENKQNPFGEPILLDDMRKNIKYAVGQPCPAIQNDAGCLLYTSPSPRDQRGSRMPSSA